MNLFQLIYKSTVFALKRFASFNTKELPRFRNVLSLLFPESKLETYGIAGF